MRELIAEHEDEMSHSAYHQEHEIRWAGDFWHA